MNHAEIKNSILGSLFGLAIGDALGAPVEFENPGSFPPVTGFQSGGPFGLPAGTWTDDTSLALCLAESLIECEGFNPTDQLTRYLSWFKTGHLSATGHCFDIGNTTQEALIKFHKTGDPFPGSTDEYSASNGSLMRLAPIPLFYHADPEQAIHYSGESSRTTHGHPVPVDACRYMGAIIAGACSGASKEDLLSPYYSPAPGYWDTYPLHDLIGEVAAGSFLTREPPEIQGRAYAGKALEAALWAFAKGKNFKESVLLAVNLGDDADTTGAICGQIAGAYYGMDGIPKEWVDGLVKKEIIEKYATDLYHASLKRGYSPFYNLPDPDS